MAGRWKSAGKGGSEGIVLKRRSIWMVAVAALVLVIQSACAQSVPQSGLYQIVSGRQIACCGIAGPVFAPLPSVSEAFIELTVDLTNNRAQIKFLGQDMRTVLRIPAEPCRGEFVYLLSNGEVFQDFIQFKDPLPPPMPYQPSYSFVVSNSVNTLVINGTVNAPCPGSADMFVTFEHTNVVAVAMPVATVRASAVEVCWNSVSNRSYQVQYRSTLTPDTWVDLAPPIVGNGSTNCTTDQVPMGQSQRYYRVLALP
jgi:hypothetical protein